jgi:hypothetical protein
VLVARDVDKKRKSPKLIAVGHAQPGLGLEDGQIARPQYPEPALSGVEVQLKHELAHQPQSRRNLVRLAIQINVAILPRVDHRASLRGASPGRSRRMLSRELSSGTPADLAFVFGGE